MSQDYFALLIDLAKIIQEPNIEKTTKEKAIKDILKQGVNISPIMAVEQNKTWKHWLIRNLAKKNCLKQYVLICLQMIQITEEKTNEKKF